MFSGLIHVIACISGDSKHGLFNDGVYSVQFSSVAQSCPTLWPHGLQHARLPCPAPTHRVYSNSWPWSWWCHLILCHPLLCLPSIFPNTRVFSNESVLHIRWPKYGVSASASVLSMNIQDWFPLGWTGWISLQSVLVCVVQDVLQPQFCVLRFAQWCLLLA